MISVNDCIRKLKYYSTDEVIGFCYLISKKLINKNIFNKIEVFPWELESFLALESVSFPKIVNGRKSAEKDFFNIINIIKNYTSPKSNNDVNLILCSLALQQFEHQDKIGILLFRYNFIFNHPDYCDFFLNRYGFNFIEIETVVFSLYAIIQSSHQIVVEKFLDYVVNVKSNVLNSLTIDYDDLKIINKNKNTDSLLLDVCPLYKKPFLKINKKLYLPLPHLLMRSVTTSKLFEFTENKKNLRDRLGSILEQYIYEITKKSNVYTEIVGEKGFTTKEGDIKTRDVNAYVDNEFLFVECKSRNPKKDLRMYSQAAYNYEVKLLSECIAKIYTSVNYHRTKYPEYNMFESKNVCNSNRNDIYCVLLVLENPFVYKNPIFNETINLLQLTSADDIEWLTTHISIMDYYTYERIVLTGGNVISYLKLISKNDYNAAESEKRNSIINIDYLQFFKELKSKCDELITHASSF